jgi:Fe-S-cluster containining protein
MQETFDFSAYAREVRKFSRSLMCSVDSGAEISGLVHLLTIAAERDLARFGGAQQSSRIDCGPGCGACCVLNVAVLFPEAVAISRFIQRRFSAGDLGELRIRMHELLVRTRWLDDEERLFLRESCAFLDQQGSCMIHAVRPLLCRAVTSTDAQVCRDAIAMVALHGAPSVEMDLFHKQLIDTVYCEFGWTLQFLGFDHRPMRLTAAVLALLDDPELVALFVSGEKVPIH